MESNNEGDRMNQKIVSTAFKGVGMAMGVAVVVLGILKAAEVETFIALLGIGLFALGLAALNEE